MAISEAALAAIKDAYARKGASISFMDLAKTGLPKATIREGVAALKFKMPSDFPKEEVVKLTKQQQKNVKAAMIPDGLTPAKLNKHKNLNQVFAGNITPDDWAAFLVDESEEVREAFLKRMPETLQAPTRILLADPPSIVGGFAEAASKIDTEINRVKAVISGGEKGLKAAVVGSGLRDEGAAVVDDQLEKMAAKEELIPTTPAAPKAQMIAPKVTSLLPTAPEGKVFLTHKEAEATTKALRASIENARNKGVTFVPTPELAQRLKVMHDQFGIKANADAWGRAQTGGSTDPAVYNKTVSSLEEHQRVARLIATNSKTSEAIKALEPVVVATPAVAPAALIVEKNAPVIGDSGQPVGAIVPTSVPQSLEAAKVSAQAKRIRGTERLTQAEMDSGILTDAEIKAHHEKVSNVEAKAQAAQLVQQERAAEAVAKAAKKAAPSGPMVSQRITGPHSPEMTAALDQMEAALAANPYMEEGQLAAQWKTADELIPNTVTGGFTTEPGTGRQIPVVGAKGGRLTNSVTGVTYQSTARGWKPVTSSALPQNLMDAPANLMRPNSTLTEKGVLQEDAPWVQANVRMGNDLRAQSTRDASRIGVEATHRNLTVEGVLKAGNVRQVYAKEVGGGIWPAETEQTLAEAIVANRQEQMAKVKALTEGANGSPINIRRTAESVRATAEGARMAAPEVELRKLQEAHAKFVENLRKGGASAKEAAVKAERIFGPEMAAARKGMAAAAEGAVPVAARAATAARVAEAAGTAATVGAVAAKAAEGSAVAGTVAEAGGWIGKNMTKLVGPGVVGSVGRVLPGIGMALVAADLAARVYKYTAGADQSARLARDQGDMQGLVGLESGSQAVYQDRLNELLTRTEKQQEAVYSTIGSRGADNQRELTALLAGREQIVRRLSKVHEVNPLDVMSIIEGMPR